MTQEELIVSAQTFTEKAAGNYISSEVALDPAYTGMQIFNPPIFAFGAADDALFQVYQSPAVIGDHFLPPLQWMQSAKTVISFFLPYGEAIRAANAASYPWPAQVWLHGRIEGQIFIKELFAHIQKTLAQAGYKGLVPILDPRFKIGAESTDFTSNWSERHIAFACGLGTFGLSKGLITEKGICGRFGSILTDLHLPRTSRPYQDTYDYCTMCGACVSRCPAKAISLAKGKDSAPCSDFLDKTLEKYKPRYGCGKCQVQVPCESKIPGK